MSQENKKGLSYEVEVTYAAVMNVGENGAPAEVEKTETVKVLRLQRTNRNHSKLALSLTKPGNDMDAVAEIAEKFVECAVDSPAKKEIQKDLMACLNIFHCEKVQEDIEDFLLKLDFVRDAVQQVQAS